MKGEWLAQCASDSRAAPRPGIGKIRSVNHAKLLKNISYGALYMEDSTRG